MASLLAISLAGACGPKAAATPRSALNAYAEALDENRLDDAYDLLTRESRAELSFEEFRELVRENPEEVKSLLAAVENEEAPPLVTATFTAESGEVFILTYENGAWRIDESAVNLYDQTEPRAALASFVRAFDQGRYDVLLKFVPDAQKEGLTQEILKASWEGEQRMEIEQMVESLRAHLKTGEIEVLGDRATMSYGAGGIVELKREHGIWKIEDLK